MVEQLGREVCNIWCYVARKNHDVAQKQYCICYFKIKKNVLGWGGGGSGGGVMSEKLKWGLRALRLKKWGGRGYQLRYQTKQKCICRKIMIKKMQFHCSFSVNFISSKASAND